MSSSEDQISLARVWKARACCKCLRKHTKQIDRPPIFHLQRKQMGHATWAQFYTFPGLIQGCVATMWPELSPGPGREGWKKEKVISASLNFGPNLFFLTRPQNRLFRLPELPKPFVRPPFSGFRVMWQQFSFFSFIFILTESLKNHIKL